MRRIQCFGLLLSGLFALSANPALAAEIYADSEAGWSADGTQGENGWFYGWYNYTNDDDQSYSPEEFDPFLNDGTDFVDFDGLNHWDGSLYRLYRDTPDTAGANTGPWTRVAQTTGHPNGENSPEAISVDEPEIAEHWAIRRWVSNRDGDVWLNSYLAADNVNCGNGTSVHLFHNGTEVSTLTTASSTAIGSSVQRTLAVGDTLDLALTPVGLDGGRGDSCDSSFFRFNVSDTQEVIPPPTAYADSADDWTLDGVQGEKNWFSGYYNRTADSDDEYQTDDFMPFVNEAGPGGGPTDPDGNHWTGTQWDLLDIAEGPWTFLGQAGTHPNGENSTPGDEHWTIRRYVANDIESTTPFELTWEMAKTNTNGGNGVEGILIVNGQQVDSASIGGGDGTGVTRKYYVNAEPGDIIELALTPNGPDGADGSRNRLTLRTELPDGPLFNPGPTIADSQAEFSEEQGADGWFYGYYDQREDAEAGDGVYSTDEFIPFLNDGSGFVLDDPTFDAWKDGDNHWDGGKWDLLANIAPTNGPWTEMTMTGGHPAANAQGDLSVHWAIRRWVSDEEGEFVISGLLNNGSGNGDGTVGRVLLDGVEIWSAVTDGDSTEVDVPVTLSVGSVLDFVIDPDGTGVYDPADPTSIDAVNDGADSTTFWVTIGSRELFIPGGSLPGDFNGNGILDAGDIDDLTTQSASMTNPPAYDLNDDALVNAGDINVWIKDLYNSWVGDANLDGEFNSGDLVSVLASGTYEQDVDSVWTTGDFNGDGRTNTNDLVAALSDGGYEQGPREATASVPEPASVISLLTGLSMLALMRRRR